jgi:hypothetical protein
MQVENPFFVSTMQVVNPFHAGCEPLSCSWFKLFTIFLV